MPAIHVSDGNDLEWVSLCANTIADAANELAEATEPSSIFASFWILLRLRMELETLRLKLPAGCPDEL